MNRTLTLLVATLLVTVALVPTAMGWRNWVYDQNDEPNVGDAALGTWDHDASKMWQTGNALADDHVEVDLVIGKLLFPFAPHPQPDEWAHRSYVVTVPHFYLGYWRDCNADGFIGDGTTGAVHYPAEQARAENSNADAICPPGSAYQDDVNVNEYLSIGPNVQDVSTGAANENVLCPDRNGGPSGDVTQTPRADANSGVLNGGDNVVCLGERSEYVQDDFSKVWFDIGLPVDPNKPTSTFFPLPDGTLKDSNGAFRYVDVFVLGQIDSNTNGLWPATFDQADPPTGNQCNDSGPGHGAEDDGLNAQAHVNNALGVTSLNCSPVPNVGYFGFPAPIGDVAWPGHLAEDRLNNSEGPNDPGTPYTAPFDEAGPDGTNADNDGYSEAQDCEFKGTNTDEWDDDPNDGDPLYGYDFNNNPTDLSAYYGTGEAGPSLDPTLGNIVTALSFQLLGGSACTYGAPVGAIEAHGAGGQSAGKVQATGSTGPGGVSFFADTSFNPSTAPGAGPDTTVCAYDNAVAFGSDHPLRCGGGWFFPGFIDVPNEAPDEYWLRTERWVAYADVSFGDTLGFDTAGDGAFSANQGVFGTPSGVDATASGTLPAGANNAHQYGDEQCADGGITLLSSGNDAIVSGTLGVIVSNPTWNCDRNAWADAAELTCSNAADELACYRYAMVGDPYDFRDVDCFDNDIDVDGDGTADAGTGENFIGPFGSSPNDNIDCDDLPMDR